MEVMVLVVIMEVVMLLSGNGDCGVPSPAGVRLCHMCHMRV